MDPLIRKYLKPENCVPYILYFKGFSGECGLIRYHGISSESLRDFVHPEGHSGQR